MNQQQIATWISKDAQQILHAGIETRAPDEQYDWYGLKRGGDPDRPQILVQHTLAGCGEYREGNSAPVRVEPEMAFCTAIPSDHRYRLPESSNSWTFQYVIVSHPYFAQRIIDIRKTLPAVVPFGVGTAVAGRLEGLIACAKGSAHDDVAVEQAIFDFLFEYLRLGASILHPAAERERLLAHVSERIVSEIEHRIGVDELAAERNMSRSHFAHEFKQVTGIPPAHYVTMVRLEEAMRRLGDARLTLEAIAAQTGFADANHFCKVFRRHIHMSPGQYRRTICRVASQ